MRRKLGINIDCIADEDPVNTLIKAKELGFNAFFTPLYSLEKTIEIKKKADELEMDFEFIHAPFEKVNDMWKTEDGECLPYDNYITSVDVASKAGVKAIIVHVSSGWTCPEICDKGLERFDKVVRYAKEKGVIIAIENLRKVGNFAYMMDRYENCDNVKFCYDLGHEHCYTATVDLMDICGKKAICTHVHDNRGRDKNDWYANYDEHKLPFDGSIDYQHVVNKLDEYEYTGSIMLEVFSVIYPEMSADEFMKTAFERAVKIERLSK